MEHDDTELSSIEKVHKYLNNQKIALDASAIISILNDAGEIAFINDNFCTISKYRKEELIGQNFNILNSGYHDLSFFEDMWNSLESGDTWKNEIRHKAKDENLFWLSTTIIPCKDNYGKIECYVAIQFDITKYKLNEIELEEKIKEKNETLKLLAVQYKQLEDFCHIISHNLRAPLHNMTMLSELLQDETNENEVHEISGKIKQVSDYLHETFDELVSIIQVRNSNTEEFKLVNLDDCLTKILSVLDAQIKESNATVTVDIDNHLKFKYNRKYLDSILLNLISNSIKYQSPNRNLHIQIRSYINDDMICIEISDNGLGLDLNKHGKQLFKLRKTFHKHPDSKGFGLFIIKSQIEGLGGKIAIDTKEDDGFKVTVMLTKIPSAQN